MSDLIIIILIIIIVNCILTPEHTSTHVMVERHGNIWNYFSFIFLIKTRPLLYYIYVSLKCSKNIQELLLDLSTNLPDMDLPLVSKASVQGLNFLLQLLHDWPLQIWVHGMWPDATWLTKEYPKGSIQSAWYPPKIFLVSVIHFTNCLDLYIWKNLFVGLF